MFGSPGSVVTARSRPTPQGFLFECYDPNEAAAERLSLLVERVMKESRAQYFAGGFITGWRRTNGPVNFPDPDTSNPRFQLTGDITVLID